MFHHFLSPKFHISLKIHSILHNQHPNSSSPRGWANICWSFFCSDCMSNHQLWIAKINVCHVHWRSFSSLWIRDFCGWEKRDAMKSWTRRKNMTSVESHLMRHRHTLNWMEWSEKLTEDLWWKKRKLCLDEVKMFSLSKKILVQFFVEYN